MTTNFPDDASSATPLYNQTGQTVPPPAYAAPVSGSDESGGKADAAKEAAGKIAGDAQDATKHVAGVTKDQAGAVASKAKSQAKDLYAQTSSQLKDQAGVQQQRVADGLRSVGDELGSMAEKSDGNGLASELVRNLSGRAGSVAGFLDKRDPGSLLDEVKSFAARKPGTFIAIAAGAGILAGRLTKALAAEAKSTTDEPSAINHTESPSTPSYSPSPDLTAPVVAVAPVDAYADNRSFDEVVEGAPVTGRPYDGDVR